MECSNQDGSWNVDTEGKLSKQTSYHFNETGLETMGK